jgi:hypothetical protein
MKNNHARALIKTILLLCGLLLYGLANYLIFLCFDNETTAMGVLIITPMVLAWIWAIYMSFLCNE